MEKTVKYGDYQITKAENGSFSVLKNDVLQENTREVLNEVANLIGLEQEEGWTTRHLGRQLIKAIEQQSDDPVEALGVNVEHFLSNFAPMDSQEESKGLKPAERLVQLALRTCVSPDDGFHDDLFDLDELMDIAVHFHFEREDIIDAYNNIMESGELLAMEEITDGVNVGLADAIIATCCGFCLTNDEVHTFQIATIHGFCKECNVNGESVTLWFIEFLKKRVKQGLDLPKFETIDF